MIKPIQIPALADNGRSDLAYKLIRNRKYGSWLYMIEKFDLTTLGEHYDLTKLNIFSYNHAFLGGSVCSWFYKHLAGISPLKPGYSKINIEPYIPEKMKYARARIQTIRGMVESAWKHVDNRTLEMNVIIPPNSTAIVKVPSGNKKSIRVNCDTPDNIGGLKLLESKDSYTSFRVGSGQYIIKAMLK